ncbi:hypothetical protein CO652_00615 [Rhizobium sp. H4]|nr:hypothetical protein CO652_00615 [Rhizobium sp. H4]
MDLVTAMTEIKIRIADFAKFPAGRDDDDGPYNGTKFRRQILVPAVERSLAHPGDRITVVLDGVLSFGSSFLEEAFGGLVREEHFPRSQLRQIIRVVADGPVYQTYKRQIEKHLAAA